MFERRRLAVSAMNFVQARRRLRTGERVPGLPGLVDQLEAFRADVARSQRQQVEDEIEIESNWEAADDQDEVSEYQQSAA